MLGLATGCCFLLAAGGVKEEQGNVTSSSSSGSGGEDGSKGIHHHTVVVVLVTLAAVVVLSALLLLLLRFLLFRRRRRRAQGDGEGGGGAGRGGEEDSATLQRQLQQLFHLHDAGLDQDVIDALPVFVYRELVLGLGAEGDEAAGSSEFDCAVCLCEFAREDALRLLPLCGHAFHVACIDTWLLSNSTCPLCRCVLAADDAAAAALLGKHHRQHDDEEEDAVLPVRLGKFKSMAATRAAGPVPNGIVRREREDGETSSSSSSLDARRCYSMGSYQYVLAEASLQVSVHRRNGRPPAAARPGGAGANHAAAAAEPGGGGEGKRIGAGSKGDSFSVSKIWQWPRNGKGKLPVLASDDSPSVNGRLPWQRRSPGDVS
ncbi:hypothetical protein PR202_ga18061 [Eleusine coracana subsp. coracana]|uniref:RING-type E3 ubiquitin transferase n=1 Tax=Eleusine coracana subsp. coracana TaxID=191504 RepID=A0AAV5CQS5_ELECO|nr:hypothetical protein QOZ80_6AG0509940 [Eleusine coracana subsp. coracana]GJN00842.1 hypothetical protein PR202_ga18061 [Eleusine coracana subsp. coracana]